MRLSALALTFCLACGGAAHPVRVGPAASRTDPEAPPAPAATPPPAPPSARVRLIHAALESRDVGLVIVPDGLQPLSGAAGFEFAGSYGSLEPGNHALSIQANGGELIAMSLHLDEGEHTLVAYSTTELPVALAHLSDSGTTPGTDTANVRFVHAIVGTGPLDVCGPSGALFSAVAIGEPAAAYVSVPGGVPLSLQLRAHEATACHGRAVGTATFTPAISNNYTLVTVGRTRGRRVAPELIFCADPPAEDTSCATVPMTTR